MPANREPDRDVVELNLGYAPSTEAPADSEPSPDLSQHEVRARTVVEADRVSYRRGGRQILRSVNVRAEPGQLLAVTGPSGSGKSTLLALLAGLDQPDEGQVRAAGKPLAGVPLFVGLILQAYGLVGVLSAAENVEIALQARGVSRPEVRRRAGAILATVGLTDVDAHLVEELSGGQQQRVAIARALVISPSVLIADEPTAELDHHSKTRVLDLLKATADDGATVVIATHDIDVAAICDQSVRLVDGAVA